MATIPQQEKKPHLDKKDYYKEALQKNIETANESPYLVVVQGPKSSGKTSLIKSFIRHYTKQKVKDPFGPITLRTNKARRMTFIECPNNISEMIDLAKIADFVLLVIDASIGFEMDTFEFLTILKTNGFPNVMGILTHLDYFDETKQMRTTRKTIKKRFAYEVGDEYRLFYLSKMKHEFYLKSEMKNLGRYLSLVKFRPSEWKLNNPFILADRYEASNAKELNQIDPEEEIDVSFFGYIRGSSYRMNDLVHITGLGDKILFDSKIIEDPCPPYTEKNENKLNEEKKIGRSLKGTERLIYAPHTNLGFINYEAGGNFVTIPDDYIVYTKKEKQSDLIEEVESDESDFDLEEGVKMVRELQNIKNGLNNELDEDNEIQLTKDMTLENNKISSKNDVEDQKMKYFDILNIKQDNQDFDFGNDNYQNLELFNKEVLCKKIETLIYKDHQSMFSTFECSRFKADELIDINENEVYIKKFIKQYNDDEEIEEDIEIKEIQNKKEDESDSESENKNPEENENDIDDAKSNFSNANSQMMTSEMGFYKLGDYVKVIIKVKRGVFKNFTGGKPIVLSKINIGEDKMGFMKIKFKKHRWYSNILKSNDPIIFSIGWKRFQSIPIYGVEDQNERFRFIKYTPNFDYCYAFVYGSFSALNAGVLCFQTIKNNLVFFVI